MLFPASARMPRRACPVLDVRCAARLGSGGVRPVPGRAAATRGSGVQPGIAQRRAPAGVADRRRLPRGVRDRREGRQRAGARLAARPARADRGRRRRRRAGRRLHRAARPRRRGRRRARAPADGQVPRAGRRGRAGERRPAGVLRRQRDLGSRRARPSRCRVQRPGGRLRVRPGPLRQRGRHQPGGPVLALRHVAAAQRVGAGVGDRRQRRDLRRAAAGLRAARARHGARPRVPVPHGQAAGVARSTCRARGRWRRWSRPSRASGPASGG